MRVIGTMPLLPSSTLRHAVSTLLPTGETMPRPVMTTRRFDKRLPLRAGHGSGVADSAVAAFPGWDSVERRRHIYEGAPASEMSGLVAALGDVIDRLLNGRDLLSVL